MADEKQKKPPALEAAEKKAEAARKDAAEKRAAFSKKKEELDKLQAEVDAAENKALIAEGKPPNPPRPLDIAKYGDVMPPAADPPGVEEPSFVGAPDPDPKEKARDENMPSGPPPSRNPEGAGHTVKSQPGRR